MEAKFIKSFDGRNIFCYLWNNVENVKGVVQIFHGMAEHAKRYENFAKELNKAGFVVFADDHRAHGKTSGKEYLGKYDGENLFFDTLKDEIFFSKMLKERYNVPLYAFGHSYGSFLCQSYIENCDIYDKAVICGSALMKGRVDVAFGKMIASLTAKLKGKDAPAKLIEKINFGGYDKKVKSGSWLNTVDKEVKKYYADDFCGKPCSAKFYVDFFSSFKEIYSKENLLKIDKNKPLLLIAGDMDPVGNMGKSMIDLNNYYKGLGLVVDFKLYKDARHEILNEKVKEEVYKDVISFLNK